MFSLNLSQKSVYKHSQKPGNISKQCMGQMVHPSCVHINFYFVHFYFFIFLFFLFFLFFCIIIVCLFICLFNLIICFLFFQSNFINLEHARFFHTMILGISEYLYSEKYEKNIKKFCNFILSFLFIHYLFVFYFFVYF